MQRARFPDIPRDQLTDAQKQAALHKTHFVDDALFKRAVGALGERGVVDLVAVSGYYTLVSMVLNVAEIPLPAAATSPW